MKRLFEMLRNAALLSAAFLMATPAYALEAGEKSPDVQLQGQSAPVKLSDSAGKLVYLDFWASWCGPCRQSFPWMNEMQAKYGPQGLQIIGVNLDARQDDAQKFLAQHPAAFTLAFDPKGDTPRQFGVKGMPTSFLIGRDGTILGSHIGFKETDRAKLEQQIEAALKAQP